MSDKPASPARGRKKTAPPAQQPPQEEVVVRLPLADLYPFPDHPFQVRDDEEMRETIQSVKEYGVIVPAIVRPREEGGYEIVAGHRRKYACEQAGLDMIFAQRPDATACAEYDLWNDTMRRYVRRGSKGIALVDNSREKPRLRYVFDISDTGLRKNSRHPFLWELRPEHEAAVAQALAERFGTPPENNLAEQLESIAAQLVSEYWVEHKRDIHIRPTFSLTGQPPRMCRSCWDILM